jgi:hypothetical protein
MNRVKNLIKKMLLVDMGPTPLFTKKKRQPNKKTVRNGIEYCEFGNLNSDKTFYVINRSSHAGIFSYLSFVLNHLLIAKDNGFIPVVDMENFTNPYNEKNKINNTFNSWEYYFNQTSNYNLEEVYNSKNVVFSRNDYHAKMNYMILEEPRFKNFKNKEININQEYINFVEDYFKKNNLNNLNILGIHFRGTSYKTSRGHIFPATKAQMKYHVDKLMLQNKFDKIFICTEEKSYLEFFKKNYLNKLLYLETYRSNKNDAFKKYQRKNHRYLLGDESIKETLILSKCSTLLYVRSNIINAANFFSDKEQNLYEIFNGFNSRNQFIARFLWYIKKILPKNLFGLENKLIKSKN